MKKLLLLVLLSTSSWANKKVLVVLSSLDYVSVHGMKIKEHKTGYFLPELTTPAILLEQAGYELVFANPLGNKPSMDKVSDSPKWFPSEGDYQKAKDFIRSHEVSLNSPLKLANLSTKDLQKFVAVFVPGGYAPMEDLYKDKNLGKILQHFHETKKPTALICHGPIALLAAKQGNYWPYEGYSMTVFSTEEEKQEETAGHLDGYLNYYVVDALQHAGGKVTTNSPWTSHVIKDRELITGQNPMSDQAFAKVLLQAILEYEYLNQKPMTYERKTELQEGHLYSLLNGKAPYQTVFLGKKLETISNTEFESWLKDHVEKALKSFEQLGLKGYQFALIDGYEVAFLDWDSKESLENAMKVHSDIPREASQYMSFVLFEQRK